MRLIPILMSTMMVQSYQKGIKTETRRDSGLKIINAAPDNYELLKTEIDSKGMTTQALFWEAGKKHPLTVVKSRYGQPGDILYMRETFATLAQDPCLGSLGRYIYKSDNEFAAPDGWTPAIHMPKAAARHFVQVVSIGVERLHSITEQGAIAEGVDRWTDERLKSRPTRFALYHHEPGSDAYYTSCPIDSYQTLWHHINGPGHWERNPWVWVIKFKPGHNF